MYFRRDTLKEHFLEGSVPLRFFFKLRRKDFWTSLISWQYMYFFLFFYRDKNNFIIHDQKDNKEGERRPQLYIFLPVHILPINVYVHNTHWLQTCMCRYIRHIYVGSLTMASLWRLLTLARLFWRESRPAWRRRPPPPGALTLGSFRQA